MLLPVRQTAVLAISLLAIARLAAAQTPSPAASPAVERYFEETEGWRFSWGTDTTFTLSNLEEGSSNQSNDGTTSFDALWMRLYGRLTYQSKAELVVDLFSADAAEPVIFGLYARLTPSPHLGLRVGLIPLVVGGWQDRAYPSRQPLIGPPLLAQYILPLRNDSLPASSDELLGQRGAGLATHYATGFPGRGAAVAIYYEHCWDTGIEAFGRLGGVRYRVAVMEGTPGSAATKVRDQKSGTSLQARLTYDFGPRLRLGGSWAKGPYLKEKLAPFLPPGRSTRDYRQALWGADLELKLGRLEARGEWVQNRYDSPFVPAALRTQGYYGELAIAVATGLRLAARYSGLSFSDLADSSGRRVSWDADAGRFEAGATYLLWEDRVALKAAVQRTRLALVPRRVENIAALQLAFSH